MATTELDELLGDLAGHSAARIPLLKLLLALGVAAIAAGATYLLLLQPAGTTPTTRSTATVTRGPVVSDVSLSGSFEAQSTADLSFGESGVVAAVHVGAGQTVKAGDLLAEIDSEAVREAVRQAQLNLEAAQIKLNQMLEPAATADLASADQSVLQAEMAVTTADEALAALREGPSASEINAADLALKQAQSQLAQAETAFTQINNGSALATEIGAAELAVEAAKLAVKEAQSNRTELRLGPSAAELVSAQASIESAELGLDAAVARRDELLAGADSGDIQLQQNQVAQLQLALESAQERLDDMQLLAPFDGTVADAGIKVGDTVGPETTAFVLHTPNDLTINLSVGDVDYADLAVGQKGFAVVDSLDGASYPVVIESLGTLPSSSQGVVTYTATARVLDPGAAAGIGDEPMRPLPGMQAQVTLVVEQRLDVLSLPTAAVQQIAGSSSVEVRNEDGTVERLPVTTGLDNGLSVEILSGLEEGQTVLLPETTDSGGGNSNQGPGGDFFIGGGDFGGGGIRVFPDGAP